MTQQSTPDLRSSLTSVTRAKVIQALDGVAWWGKLDDVAFLQRLYDLNQLPSTDSRFADAEGDICQHRFANDDWPDTWIYADERFGLSRGADRAFLRFLAEMLHPEVRDPTESRHLVLRINRHLSRDGWEIIPTGAVSGYPTYGMQERDRAAMLAPDNFPIDLEQTVASVAETLKHRQKARDLLVLASSEFEVTQTSYDNWNGGTTGWGLNCAVEAGAYTRLSPDERADCESNIKEVAVEVFRAVEGHFLERVMLIPRAADKSAWRTNAKIANEMRHKAPEGGQSARSTGLPLGATVQPSAALTVPRSCASAVKAIVMHLRDELVFATAGQPSLRMAVQHFDVAVTSAQTTKVPVELHSDKTVNGWLLLGARQLLATGRSPRDRLRELAGRLAQGGAEAPHGHAGTSFERVRNVGSGSYGTVWNAIRVDTATPVAVKQCHAQDGAPPDGRFVEALRKEAMCLMRLSHPAIPRFVACDFDRPDPYLAMQFVDGERLGTWLLRSPSFAEQEHVLRSILGALDHAHGLSIHHRDLKTDNILVAPGPRAFVIDWGGAKTMLPEQQTATPAFLANIRNSAPEWILHVRSGSTTPFSYTAAQDMWSFGVIAYHVLTGRHPFDVPGDPLQTIENVLHANPAPLSAAYGHWGPLVTSLLDRGPAERPASCADVLESLERGANIIAG